MSEDEINKAVKEAAEYEAQDKKRKEAIDARNDADAAVFQVEKALEEAGDKISSHDKTAVEADLNALKETLKNTPADNMTDAQVADLKAGQEKLMKSAQSLFTKMYENMQQNNSQGGQAGPGPDQNAGGQAGGSGDDDVVDADYKEV